MKRVIKHYLLLTAEEKKELWQKAIFVFDANTLLNLYRYTEETKKSFLNLISKIKEKVWIPNQVAIEFAKNRYSIIKDNKEKYTYKNQLQKDKTEFINKIKTSFRGHTNIYELEQKIDNWIESQREIYKPVVSYDNDEILNSLLTIFDGKVGSQFSEEELLSIKKEGEKRYTSKIPPGFCDNAKDESDKYGDLLIWKEIISFSKNNNKNIIFITDDKKEDWFYSVRGEAIGPRPELSIEFEKETGCSFYLYTMEQFIKYSNEEERLALRQSVVDEIKSLRIEEDNLELFEKKLFKLKNQYFNHLISEIEQNRTINLSDVERVIAFYLTQQNYTSQSLTEDKIKLLNYLRGYINSYYVSSTLLNEQENKYALERISNDQNLMNIINEILKSNNDDENNNG